METLEETISQMSISMPKTKRTDTFQNTQIDLENVNSMILYYENLRKLLENDNPDIVALKSMVYDNKEHNATDIVKEWNIRLELTGKKGREPNRRGKKAEPSSETQKEPLRHCHACEEKPSESGAGNHGANSSRFHADQVRKIVNEPNSLEIHADEINADEIDADELLATLDHDYDWEQFFPNSATNGRKPRPEANFFLSPWGLR